jgi:serine/threonine protein kinase
MDILEKIIPKVGQQIGRYALVEELGRGGFGIVYRARQIGLDVDVALKLMLPNVSSQFQRMQLYERFQQEAKVLRRLEHPSVVKVRDFGKTSDGLPYLVTEYVRGKTLEYHIDQGPLDLDHIIRISKQVLGCLGEAHHMGILHRDMKPANIMLHEIYGEHDQAKVLDFGIAKVLKEQTHVHTQTGMAMGTPWYMAPEQAKGRKDLDGRVDLYALGLIIAECITGRRVVKQEDLVAAVLVHAGPEPIEFEREVLQSILFPIIRRATQKDPKRRYRDAVAMRQELRVIELNELTRDAGGRLGSGYPDMQQAILTEHLVRIEDVPTRLHKRPEQPLHTPPSFEADKTVKTPSPMDGGEILPEYAPTQIHRRPISERVSKRTFYAFVIAAVFLTGLVSALLVISVAGSSGNNSNGSNLAADGGQDVSGALNSESEERSRIHLMLYQEYERIGDRSRAADSLERYLDLNPTHARTDEYRQTIERLRQ